MNIPNLGSKAKHTITGYTGVIVARTEWLNGCWRITIQAEKLHDGQPKDPCSFDIQEVEVLKEDYFKPVNRQEVQQVEGAPSKSLGGPHPNPTRSKDPR